MPKEEKIEEKNISIELKPSEIFQLHLCVLNRMGNAQIKFCNACNEEEQKTAEGLLTYCQKLDIKLLNALKGEQVDGEK